MAATIADGGTSAEELVRLAFGALERPADRNLLRLRGAGASVHGLARMFRTTEDTIARWLAALRAQLLEDARFRLGEQVVDPGALEAALDALLTTG